MKDRILVDFPRSVLKTILSRLVETNRVVFDGRYRLSPHRRRDITTQTQVHLASLEGLIGQLVSKTEQCFGSELSAESRELVEGCFFRFVSTLFMERASILAKLIAGHETPEAELSIPATALDETLKLIGERQLREAVSAATLDTLRNPTQAVVDFLVRLNENLICIQVLNLDPECQKVEREAFSRINLLLDTNIIMDLLCSSSRRHRLSRELLSLTRHVGANLQVTRRTLKEFLNVLEDANNRIQKLEMPTRFLVVIDDEFIASYSKEKEMNPHLRWEGYYLRMKRVDSLLRNNWGVAVYDEDRKEILEREGFPEIANQVSKCYKKIKHQIKQQRVAEHDAYHLILIRELRNESPMTMLGPSHWFLTHDQTLPCADPLVTQKFAYEEKTISTMLADIWLQMIEPFLGRDVREKQVIQVFSELLKSQFSGIPFRIESSKMAELQGEWLDCEWLEPTDLEKILGEKFVAEYLSKLTKMRVEGEDTSSLTEDFKRKLEIRVESLAGERIRQLTDKLANLETLVRQTQDRERLLKSQLSAKEEEFRRGVRSKASLVGFILMFACLFLSALGVIRDWLIIAVICLSGVVLVIVAAAPEQVRARIETLLRLRG